MSTIDESLLTGPAAPPLANGELVFEAPWESRAFGMAHALVRQGAFTWDEFRACLIDELARRDQHARPEDPFVYYEHWLRALERLSAERALCPTEELLPRAREYAARPHGHDHGHDHHHHHHEAEH